MTEQGTLTEDWRLKGKERQVTSISGTWILSRQNRHKYLPDGDDDGLADRWERSLSLTASVTPIAPGMYQLSSAGSGNDYIIDLDGYANGERRAVCECNDYRYNAGPEGIDCKHILYVKREVRNGLLPPVGVDPVEWLHKRLDDLESALEPYRDAEVDVSRVEEMVGQMRDKPYTYEYRKVVDTFHQTVASPKSIGAFTPRY